MGMVTTLGFVFLVSSNKDETGFHCFTALVILLCVLVRSVDYSAEVVLVLFCFGKKKHFALSLNKEKYRWYDDGDDDDV